MKKILIIDDSEDVVELANLIIETKFNIPTLSCSNCSETYSVLDQNQANDIFLIISDYNLPDGNAMDIFQHLCKKEKQDIPFILLTGAQPQYLLGYSDILKANPNNGHFPKPFTLDDLSLFLSPWAQRWHDEFIEKTQEFSASQGEEQQLQPDASEISEIAVEERYYQVAINKFLLFPPIKLHISVQLSSSKYVVIARNDAPYDQNLITKYAAKGVKHLYLNHSNYQLFMDYLLNSSWEKLDQPQVELHQQIRIKLESLQEVGERFTQLGVGPTAMKVAQQIAESSLKTVMASKQLVQIFQAMMEERGLAASHALLMSYLTPILCAPLTYATEQVQKSLSLGALLHDIGLKEDSWCLINSQNESAFKRLETSNQKRVIDHPSHSAQWVEKIPEATPEIIQALANHHERPDGGGFPRGLLAKDIPYVSALFILIEEVGDYLLRNPWHPNTLQRIIFQMEQTHTEGDFAKILADWSRWAKAN